MISPTPSGQIAIIGAAGRFPDAPDLRAFWRNLEAGLESLVTFTDEELRAQGIDSGTLSNSNFVKKGTLLEGADLDDERTVLALEDAPASLPHLVEGEPVGRGEMPDVEKDHVDAVIFLPGVEVPGPPNVPAPRAAPGRCRLSNAGSVPAWLRRTPNFRPRPIRPQ